MATSESRSHAYASPGRTRQVAPTGPWSTLGRPSRVVAILEIALSVSGVGLATFMVLHLGLLSTILAGSGTLDRLAVFLERYYLLQIGAPLVILLVAVHVVLAMRKVPTRFGQQRALLRHLGSIKHVDSWTWAFQIVTAGILVALGAAHLWVILTDLPIEADKSGARVFGIYLWMYVPLILVVEAHISIGLYRVAVKWGLLPRRWAHVTLLAWTALFLGLGFAILTALYQAGGRL